MAIYLPLPNTKFTRFAFYSSLNTHHNVSISDASYTSSDAYNMAMNYLQNGLKTLQDKKNSSSAYRQALDLLKRMADNELQKEQRLLLSKVNDKSIPQEIRDLLLKTCDSNNFDYDKFLKGMNSYYLKVRNLNAKIDTCLEDMRKISKSIEDGFSRYRHFSGDKRVKLKKTILKSGHGDKFKFTLGNKKNRISSRISKSKVVDLAISLKSLEKTKITLADFDKKSYQELSQKIINLLNDKHQGDIFAAITGDVVAKNNIIKVLDYLTIMYFQDYINEINALSRESSADFYVNKGLISLFNGDNPEAESKLAQSVNEAYDFFIQNTDLITDLAKEILGDSISYNDIIRLRKEGMEEAKKIIKELNLKNNQGNDIKFLTKDGFSKDANRVWQVAENIIKSSNDSYLERQYNRLKEIRKDYNSLGDKLKNKQYRKGNLSVEAEKSQALESGFHNNVIKSIRKGQKNAKDDTLTFHLLYAPPELDITERKEFDSKLVEAVSAATLGINDIANNGSMDLKELKARFLEQQKIYKTLEETLLNLKNKFLLEKDSLNIFVEHGTTKEYTFFSNLTGFNAGAIGENDTVISAINNIQLMAHKGGISFADKEWLIFAVMNCAKHLIGAEINIQPTLENYLSLIAGALMFEDADNIMLEVNKKINAKKANTIEHIHIYRLSNFYFPLSYILNETWKDLRELDNYLMDAKHSGNQIHILSKARGTIFDSVSQDTWIREGKYTLDSTTITMTFMAGFLDVLEKLKITTI